MKKIITLVAVFFTASYSFSQQIGDYGYAPFINEFNIPLKSGLYTGLNALGAGPDTSSPRQYLFLIRHIDSNNNHQLQLSSSYTENDRFFFRKIANDLTPSNSKWFEVATRGTNTFIGDQVINGNVGLGTITPSSYEHGGNNKFLEIYNSNTTVHSQSHIILSSGANLPNSSIGTMTWALPNTTSNFKGAGYLVMRTENSSTSSKPATAMVFATRSATNDFWSEQMIINSLGNVGIGLINPNNKLDVNGTIHSKEVKVDMLGWSDFVFKKEYNLPSLAEVEKHIAEKGHLENIPSEEEVLKNGINLGEMNAKLLQKIEELTLYMIEMKKENIEMKKENTEIKNKQIQLENKVKELTNKLK
ncbi:hypothetical protein [Flavobacterium chilense]|uniref:Cell wall anchor protein n=1 Tax=Flavobacterium chilense TaxID=946677 RepID=A0A1M7AVW4_9FLAO|nr:hypothetical protein [Flavobacterium chilense]SHL46787.1 hypothetical protein SAMN05444484_1011584 [Flavobacterium chilense]